MAACIAGRDTVKKGGKAQTNTGELCFPLEEAQIDALSAAPSNLSSWLAAIHRSGAGEGSAYSEPLLKSTLVLGSQKFLKVALKRLHEVSLHSLLLFFFFLFCSTTSFPNERRQHFSQSISSEPPR